jgi:hypothetical protein
MAPDGTKLEGILNIKIPNNYFKDGKLMPRAIAACKNTILEEASKNGYTDKSLMMQKIDEARNTWKKLAGTIYATLDDPDLLNSMEKSQLEVVAFEMLHEGTFRVPLLLQSLPKDPSLLDVVKKVAETSRMETIESLDIPDNEEQFYAKRAEGKQFDNINPGQKGWKDRKVLQVRHIDENMYPDRYKVGVSFCFGTHNTNDTFGGDMYFDKLGHYRHWKAFHRDLAHSLIEKGLWDPENKVLGTKYDIAKVKDILLDCYVWFIKSLEEGGKLHKVFLNTNH